jgi:hypothetical protein
MAMRPRHPILLPFSARVLALLAFLAMFIVATIGGIWCAQSIFLPEQTSFEGGRPVAQFPLIVSVRKGGDQSFELMRWADLSRQMGRTDIGLRLPLGEFQLMDRAVDFKSWQSDAATQWVEVSEMGTSMTRAEYKVVDGKIIPLSLKTVVSMSMLPIWAIVFVLAIVMGVGAAHTVRSRFSSRLRSADR